MKKIFLAMSIFCIPLFSQGFVQNSQISLFSDFKARSIGDAITIIVVESSQASNQSETSTGRSSDIGIDVSGKVADNSIPGVNAKIGTGNNFKGAGSTKTSGQVKTKISATVDSVLNNGNLRIKGTRKITINGEEQLIQIVGIVRPSDILSDNSVYSFNISEAEIVFEGSGQIGNSQKPGWLTRLFHWLF